MNYIKFGYILKKMRTISSLSRRDFILALDSASSDICSVDSVTICRWEKNIIAPCHRKQMEIIKQLNYNLLDLIDKDSFTVGRENVKNDLFKKLDNKGNWDFINTNVSIDNIQYSIVHSKKMNKSSHIYTDLDGFPLGQVTFSIEKEPNFDKFLVIKSIFFNNRDVFFNIFNLILNKLISKEITRIMFYSAMRTSPINKLLKLYGFKMISNLPESKVLSLDYNDLIYNKLLLAVAFSNSIPDGTN